MRSVGRLTENTNNEEAIVSSIPPGSGGPEWLRYNRAPPNEIKIDATKDAFTLRPETGTSFDQDARIDLRDGWFSDDVLANAFANLKQGVRDVVNTLSGVGNAVYGVGEAQRTGDVTTLDAGAYRIGAGLVQTVQSSGSAVKNGFDATCDAFFGLLGLVAETPLQGVFAVARSVGLCTGQGLLSGLATTPSTDGQINAIGDDLKKKGQGK